MVRICDRRKVNAGMHCQMVACLEGPVCEEYTNAKKSVGNSLYPTMPAFQNLLNDNCHASLFEGMDGENKICTTSVFLPIAPCATPQPPMTPRSFNIHLFWPTRIDESMVEFDDKWPQTTLRSQSNTNRHSVVQIRSWNSFNSCFR